jgi:hypothetical protein
MKKIIAILILFLETSSIFGQGFSSEKIDSLIYIESREFINKVNENYINNSKYAVFVIRGIETDTAKNSFSFSLSYILNSYNYNSVSPSHYFFIDTNLIIIALNYNFDIKYLDFFKPEKISEKERIMIQKKLFPKEIGGITYSSKGLLIIKSKDEVTSIFFKDSDLMPRDSQRYIDMPQGIIKKIR